MKLLKPNTSTFSKQLKIMLTEEQIKNLKPGDPVIIHGTFVRQCANSDILCKVAMWYGGDDFGIVADSHFYARPRCVSLPSDSQSKHDPYRRFKKGDIVEPKQVKGRVYSNDSKHLIGKKCIVFRDEEEPGYVVISYAGKNYSINAAYLELVTPVEELEPYSVVDAHTHWDVADKNMKTVATYSKMCHPHAKEAAEAERDRLNEEYRKEQK